MRFTDRVGLPKGTWNAVLDNITEVKEGEFNDYRIWNYTITDEMLKGMNQGVIVPLDEANPLSKGYKMVEALAYPLTPMQLQQRAEEQYGEGAEVDEETFIGRHIQLIVTQHPKDVNKTVVSDFAPSPMYRQQQLPKSQGRVERLETRFNKGNKQEVIQATQAPQDPPPFSFEDEALEVDDIPL